MIPARRVEELAESATLAVSAKAARMKAEGVDVIAFGAGEPDFDTARNIKDAAIRALHAGETAYVKPASGLLETKRAVCEKLARINNLTYTPEQVIVTPGGKMAVYLAVQAIVDPGDEVVIPVPYWVSYPEIVRLAGGVPVFVTGQKSRDFRLTPEELEAALTSRTKLLIFNSPSNPSGVCYDPDQTRALAAVLKSRDIWVLSDEIYDQLVFGGQKVLSFAAAGDDAYGRTVTVNAPSKTYAMTGWRLGYAAGPASIIKAMGKLQSQTTSGACTFNQFALTEALRGDQEHVEAMRREFEARAELMYSRLCAIRNVWCPRPTGAFFCFPDVSAWYPRLGVGGSLGFAERLLTEAHVAVVPGEAFGMDRHVRLSFAASKSQIEQGLSRIQALLK